MKKLFVLILTALFVSKSFAQLTLLHTFDGNAQVSANYVQEQLNKYFVRTDNTIEIYGADFSLEKTVTLSLPAGYSISLINWSQHFFNTDSHFEFFVSAVQTGQPASNTYHYAAIVNDEGTVIKDFGYAYLHSGNCYMIAGQPRFVLLKYIYNGTPTTEYETEVYSCAGNYTGIAPNEASCNSLPYPNPASSVINLPYEIPAGSVSQMRIFNSNGQLMEVKSIGSHFNSILLNVDNYPAGLYFYEYDGSKGKFIVQ